MPLYTADALILRTYKLAESDRIVVFLTSDRGKRRGVARGARKTRSRFGGGLEPFTRARVEYFEREQRDLVRLSYVEPVVSPLSCSSGDVLEHVSYFAELVDAWALEADPNDTLYRLGASVVDALIAGLPVDRVARYFEYWLLRIQGVYPSLVSCHECGGTLEGGGAIARATGVLRCRRCGVDTSDVDLPADAVAFLRGAARVRPERVGELTLSGQGARQLAIAHRALIAMHLDRDLRSARVLRELGAGLSNSPNPAKTEFVS